MDNPIKTNKYIAIGCEANINLGIIKKLPINKGMTRTGLLSKDVVCSNHLHSQLMDVQKVLIHITPQYCKENITHNQKLKKNKI